MSSKIDPRFTSNWTGLIKNPLFLVRRGLYESIEAQAHCLHGKLLDFGCGRKPYAHLISCSEYVGLDLENPGHDHACEDIDVFYDGKVLPFADNYFDSILCSEVLEHLFDPQIVLTEWRRVLRPGGTILVTTPFVWNEHELPHDAVRYTENGLKHLLERAGFDILHFEKKGTFIEVLFQLWHLYLIESILPSTTFTQRVIWPICCLPGNIFARLACKVSRNQSMYLSNICVARKPVEHRD